MARTRLFAVLQGLLVTFLWSTSWVLIKIGLEDIEPLPFAGLRYGLAFLILLPFALRRGSLRGLSGSQWRALLLLGLVMYALTQGSQFLALAYLPAQTTSLVLSFTPALVALLGMTLLAEPMRPAQGWGILLYLAGAVLYFYPAALPGTQVVGLVVIGIGLLANAFAGILGRAVNRARDLGPLTVTVISMGFGSLLLLVTGVAVSGPPRLDLGGWGIVAWLALVNTAFAFTLWNHTLRTLSAMESSIINNTMLIQIAVLAWIFLGESLGPRQLVGLTIAATGILLVQIHGRSQVRQARAQEASAAAPTADADRGGAS